MPQPKKGSRLGSGPKHQRLMLSNLALSLFEHERIKTTETKAKALRPYAEKLITKAKRGSVHNRRQVLAVIEDREIVHKLFAEIAPRFAERNGGYTRILKLGQRNGDGASMCLIELVEGEAPAQEEEESGPRRRSRRPVRRKGAAATGRDESPESSESAESSDSSGSPESPGSPDSPEAAADPDEDVDETATEASDTAVSGDEDPTSPPGDATADTAQDEPEEDK